MISLLPLLPEKDELAPDLQRAAQYIDAHLDDSLTIGDVAAAGRCRTHAPQAFP